MLKKDDQVTIEIEDIGTDGAGIGKADGYTLFVKDAVIGDIIKAKVIKAKKTYGYARLMEIITPSKDRVEPVCPVARQCGGCQIQQMSYSAQLKYKQKLVRDNLARIGGITDCEVLPVIGMENPFNYRNKAQFPFGLDKNGNIVAGFYAGRTHDIIECEDCLLGVEENKDILGIIKGFMRVHGIRPYDETTHKGLVRHALIRKGFHSGEIMVCLVINGKDIPAKEQLVEELCQVKGMTSISYSINQEKTNVIMGKEIVNLYGPGYITDNIGNVTYQISSLSFYQVNPVQTEKLYGTALEYAGLTGKETVWDLYCGIGTISLFLAGKAKKVCGVEIIPQAIDDARENAKRNHIENAEFFVGKAEEVLPEFYKKATTEASSDEMLHPDVIVVDPPRKGCDDACLNTMLRMQPERIVYVSCDSATLARDLKILCDGGYEIRKVRGVDQFGMTVHVESVVLMQYCGK